MAWKYHTAELRADFQQYYALDIDGLGEEIKIPRAADLCAQLPRKSRVFCALDPENRWDDNTWLLARIDHAVRVLIWQNTADGQDKNGGKNYPEMIRPDKREKPKKRQLTSDQYLEILSRRREDV